MSNAKRAIKSCIRTGPTWPRGFHLANYCSAWIFIPFFLLSFTSSRFLLLFSALSDKKKEKKIVNQSVLPQGLRFAPLYHVFFWFLQLNFFPSSFVPYAMYLEFFELPCFPKLSHSGATSFVLRKFLGRDEGQTKLFKFFRLSFRSPAPSRVESLLLSLRFSIW